MANVKPDQLVLIEHFAKHHPMGRLLSEMKNWNFQAGDVIIRMLKDHSDNTVSVDMVSDNCQVPKKYKVILIDELGAPWVKQLSVRGGMSERLVCLATIDLNRYTYRVDPEQLEASLLGYKYDPRIEYKRMRAENPNYGNGTKNASDED